MSDDDDGIEFKEPPLGQALGAAGDEQRMYESHPRRPNSFFLRIGKSSHLSYQSEGATPVLALVMLIVILLAMVIIAVSAAVSSGDWATAAMTGLSQALLAIIGAILGSQSRSK